MTTHCYLPEEAMIEKAVDALGQALDPVETARFLALSRHKKIDSVAWHRQGQDSLDGEELFQQVFPTGSEK